MRIVRQFLGASLLLLIHASITFASAGDIGDDIRGTESGSATKNGGFLEIGLLGSLYRPIRHTLGSDSYDKHRINLQISPSISAGYRFNRLFIEASESGFDGLNMGVNLFDSERWSADLLVANIDGSLSIGSDDLPAPTSDSERDRAILERDTLSVGAGVRLTGYLGDAIVQMRLVSDWYDGNGIKGSVRAGKRWQLGNWNVQAIAGVRYNSAEFNNYVFGVTSEEQSERFTQYKAASALIPEVELGASLPVRENWVYSTRLRLRSFPSSVSNSPLVANDVAVILTSGIHYVF